MAASNTIYITYVEKYASFLKVWGQMERHLPVVIENSLSQMNNQFDQGRFMPTMDNIQCGQLCCAKYKDGNYYRARITNTALLHQALIEVHFVDYGNRDMIPAANLRVITDLAPGLITIPAQAREFILASVTHHGAGWDNDTVALITSEIRYMELIWVAVGQAGTYTLINLYNNNREDIARNLFNRGIVLPIASTAQHMILQPNMGNISPPYMLAPQQMVMAPATTLVPVPPPIAAPTVAHELLTYKSTIIEPGIDNQVYISYVSDGPCHFSVQLKRMEDALARLMKEINRMTLQPLDDDPIPGTVCVARCLEDQHICRAVVTSLVDGQYKVFYVDFGNTEIVPLDNLYQVPFKYVLPRTMAMRYSLAGLDRPSVTLEMKCAFKEFVNDKLLRMRTLQPSTRSSLPVCQLWNDKNVNVLEVLQQAALLAYPETIQLSRGFSQEIRVSYVHSCNHFYVQIKAKEEELCKVMSELQVKCPQADPLLPSQVKIGLPCCALFDADGQWYRAQILIKEGDNVKVRYVDYGNEELVAIVNLRMPLGEQLTALRPQALECCLNGYQNMEDDLERDGILEELILEKEFVMKVVEMQANRALVDLNDSMRYNVGSLLLEKLANAKSQVSPLLIQDSHHIEQRKRISPQRLQRRSSRNSDNNDKGWNNEDKGGNKDDKGYDNKDSWRQTRPPRRDEGEERSTGNDGFERGKGRRDGYRKESWGGTNGEREAAPQWKQNAKPNQREGSEKSWSDNSERSWRRTTGTHTQNDERRSYTQNEDRRSHTQNEERRSYTQNEDRRPKRKPDAGKWNSGNNDNTWNSSSNDTVAKVVDPAPNSAKFAYPDLNGRCENVLISWFHDPAHFFCQFHASQDEFKTMMEEIQNTYCKIKADHVPVNAPAIALFPDDGVMYRARVLEIKAMRYRVQYVDFGNVAMTDKVWPIEKKFMQLPAQAISCGLSGLVSPENGWPNPDLFSTYFAKELFTCTFISGENQNYLVDLTSDNQSVAEAIVSAGLAQAVTAGVPESFDPSLLLGQQIKIVVGDVQSLDMFYVYLENGVPVLCTVHNFAAAVETFEDTLRQYIGANLIMYVDNVLDEKVEITLYDSSGIKVKIVQPDEGAFETVELPCAFPVLYPTINGWISYLTPSENDKHRLYMQPAEYANILAELLGKLFNYYDATSLETPLQPEIDFLYAVRSSDTNWYRGKVVSLEDETVTVTFVDYGNSESVALTEVRELAPEFMEQHLLAVEILASGVDYTFIEQEVTACVWYGENGWEAEIQKSDQSGAQAQPEPLPDDQPVAIPEEPAQPSEEQAVTEVAPEAQIQPTQVGVPVILSHIDSPSEFYLQLSEDLETIDKVQAILQEQALGFADLETPLVGVLCAASYSLDQLWYRAQVLDADVDITTVRFVDYGNTDVLTNVANHVKTLPPDLLSFEQHARRCSLIVKAIAAEWSPAAFERFEILTGVDNLSAEIVHQDEKTTYIELYADGQNVAEILLREGLAIKLQLETESSCSGYVSHLNSPSEFWVQLENSVADLEWIAEQLSSAENFPELEDLTPGSLCAALFPDDEMWYRARILSNTVAGLEVVFIDYGNSCTCTGLRQLPEDLIMLAALAQKCSLQRPAGVLQWSTQATEEFRTISADGATIFTIDKLSTGETSVVRLLLEGQDITAKLLAETQDALISHFESIFSFWLQKSVDIPKLDTITAKLGEAAEWPKYEQKEGCDIVAALYAEDEQWYRARLLNENDSVFEVLFIDFGNTATTSEIRMISEEIEKEPPLAMKYKLDPLPGFRWNDDSSKKLAEISNYGATIFQVEFINGDVVRLYLNGNDIRSELDSICISSAHSTPKKIATRQVGADTTQGIENFVDAHSASFVLSDINISENLIVETPQEQEHQSDESCLLTEDDKFQTALSMSEEKSIEDLNNEQIVTKVKDEQGTHDEIKQSEECDIMQDAASMNGEKSTDKEEQDKLLLVNDAIKESDECELMQDASKASEGTVTAELTGLEKDQKDIEKLAFQEMQVAAGDAESSGEFVDAVQSAEIAVESESAAPKAEVDVEVSTSGTDKGLTSEYSVEEKLNLDDATEHDPHTDENVAKVTSELAAKAEVDVEANTSETNKLTSAEANLNLENGTEHDTHPSTQALVTETDTLIHDETELHNISQQASTEQLSASESPVHTRQRLPSTPYSEKIVPGCVSRGDLTKPEDNGVEQGKDTEQIAPAFDEHEDQIHTHKIEQSSHNISLQASDEQPSPSESPVHTPERRPSTPHSEKIVPGSVCRGDLTEIQGNDVEEVKNTDDIELAFDENEGNKICVHVKGLGSTESSMESPKSFCKGPIDERIVPGTVSRGETPEPDHSGDVLLGAVNGDHAVS